MSRTPDQWDMRTVSVGTSYVPAGEVKLHGEITDGSQAGRRIEIRWTRAEALSWAESIRQAAERLPEEEKASE